MLPTIAAPIEPRMAVRERRGPGGSPGLQNRWRHARRDAVGSTPMRSRHRVVRRCRAMSVRAAPCTSPERRAAPRRGAAGARRARARGGPGRGAGRRGRRASPAGRRRAGAIDRGAGRRACQPAGRLRGRRRARQCPAVINATGVIIHTNLGRAPWPRVAIEAARAAAADPLAPRARPRVRSPRPPVPRRRGAPDRADRGRGRPRRRTTTRRRVALAVGLAGRGGRVVVSRGELVEIGGGVRIPEIVRRAGARLVEVGTTNRTRVADYTAALEGGARLVLRVHPSNFRQEGFVEAPDAAALAALAHRHDAILVDDLGSGALLDTAGFGLAHEPTAAERLAAGADLVTFSGDKLVGGPQAGLIVGRAGLVGAPAQGPARPGDAARQDDAGRPRRDARAVPGRAGGPRDPGLADDRGPPRRPPRAGRGARGASRRPDGRCPGRRSRGDRRRWLAAGRDAPVVGARAAGCGRAARGAPAGRPGGHRPDRGRPRGRRPADRRPGARRGPGRGDRGVCGGGPNGRSDAEARSTARPMTVVVGTAGHIDHGKTSLLRALTGIDADRLPEERRRGMTIDVGYAHLDLPDGSQLDFVDVPGHDRLVGNMLVGAGEVDAALLVVAADDGPRAQTLEHLELLDALGIGEGIAVVTKIDLVDGARAAEVVEAVRRLLARTTLAGSPVLAVSSSRGDGLDELRAALVALRDRVLGSPGGQVRRRDAAIAGDPATERRGDRQPVRLAIDRVFSVKGRGVVVTGSLRGGRLARGTSLRLEPAGSDRPGARAPGPRRAGRSGDRWRAGGAQPGRDPGHRPGAGRGPHRRPGRPTDRPADGDPAGLRRGSTRASRRRAGRHRLGRSSASTSGPTPSRRHPGRGRSDAVDLPDGRRVATLRLARPVAAAVGDPFALRVPSPAATAAGGIVIDVAPPIGVSRRRATPDALAALATAWLAADATAELAARVRLHGLVPRPTRDGDMERRHRAAASSPAGSSPRRRRRRSTPRRSGSSMPTTTRSRSPRACRSPRSGARSHGRSDAGSRPTSDGRRRGRRADRDARRERRTRSVRRRRPRSRAVERAPSRPTCSPRWTGSRPRWRSSPRRRSAMPRVSPRCPAEGVRALEASGRIVRVEPDLAWAGTTYRELEALAVRLADPGPLTPARCATRPGRAASTSWPCSRTSTGGAS